MVSPPTPISAATGELIAQFLTEALPARNTIRCRRSGSTEHALALHSLTLIKWMNINCLRSTLPHRVHRRRHSLFLRNILYDDLFQMVVLCPRPGPGKRRLGA